MTSQLPTPARRQSITLRAGDSVSLRTGEVTRNAPLTDMIPSLSVFLNLRLSSNDLNALRSAFQLTACAWTTEACHRYVDRCGQHPRSEPVFGQGGHGDECVSYCPCRA